MGGPGTENEAGGVGNGGCRATGIKCTTEFRLADGGRWRECNAGVVSDEGSAGYPCRPQWFNRPDRAETQHVAHGARGGKGGAGRRAGEAAGAIDVAAGGGADG